MCANQWCFRICLFPFVLSPTIYKRPIPVIVYLFDCSLTSVVCALYSLLIHHHYYRKECGIDKIKSQSIKYMRYIHREDVLLRNPCCNFSRIGMRNYENRRALLALPFLSLCKTKMSDGDVKTKWSSRSERKRWNFTWHRQRNVKWQNTIGTALNFRMRDLIEHQFNISRVNYLICLISFEWHADKSKWILQCGSFASPIYYRITKVKKGRQKFA